MQETERQLIEAIRAGDREAFKRLYERFARYAMGVTLRYVPKRDDALDIVQDSFISIITSIATFEYRGEGSLKSWVSKIISRQAVSWMKEHEQLSFSELTLDEIEEEDDPAIEKVPKELVNEMIGRLPVRYRVVVNLRAFEELSHKDIALRLGISEKASTTLFSRAKRKLAMMIKEYLNSQEI
ncbi:MAG: RNA polymerase sigma factor [Prevotella sp.]|nr:RNA polymerase sigma factor [Prevotella sp.]